MTLYLFNLPEPSPQRPKTKLIFHNKDLCTLPAEGKNNQLNLIIVVISARDHFKQRHYVRRTYGSVRNANNINILSVVFMLGNLDEPGAAEADLNVLEAEKNQFGDVVIGDFVDAYRNLTLKTIMAYEWVGTFCREAQIVVKTDDDVLVNVFKLTEILNTWSSSELKSSNIWCMIHNDEKTIEDPASKYYASLEEFPTGKFPGHCGGLAYVTNNRVIERISDEISKSFLGDLCTHEDVFMTSIVPKRINSIPNSFWERSEPIKLVDKRSEWFTLDLEEMKNKFLVNVLRQPEVLYENIDHIRSRYENTIFYLMAHTDDYEQLYFRLWYIFNRMYST